MSTTHTVLLISGSKMNHRIGHILSSIGMEVVITKNILNAFIFMEEHAPHIVILDRGHEQKQFKEFLLEKQKKSFFSDIPLLLYVEKGGVVSEEKLEDMGVFSFIYEPLVPAKFQNQVKKYLRPMYFPPFVYIKEENNQVEGEFAAEVTEIGPASIIIKSNVRFQLNDKPNIRSEFLSKLSLSHHNLEVTFPSKTLNISKFKTRLSILGLDPEEVSKLYRYINDS